MKHTDNKYGNYGEAALKAHNKIKNQQQAPNIAWDEAICELQCAEKPCPKSTFLGLCEEGLIKYVENGNYTHSKKNKIYALEAVSVLKINQIPENDLNPCFLWNSLKKNINPTLQTRIKYNQQMEVVLALWEADLIL